MWQELITGVGVGGGGGAHNALVNSNGAHAPPG